MWLTAILLGVTGSLHCAGMCSPLMTAVLSLRPAALLNRFLYNAGRIFSYGILGALFSGLGYMLPLSKYQYLFSLFLGIGLLAAAVFGASKMSPVFLNSALGALTGLIKTKFAVFLRDKSYASVVVLGALNGVLPCGLTFAALAFCITLQGPVDGLNFMLLFGLGTLPVMLGFTGVLLAVTRRVKFSLPRMASAMMALSGVLLIVRVLIHAGADAAQQGAGVVDIVLCR